LIKYYRNKKCAFNIKHYCIKAQQVVTALTKFTISMDFSKLIIKDILHYLGQSHWFAIAL